MARGRLMMQKGRQRRGRGRAMPAGRRGRRRSPLPFDSQAQLESAELGNEAADTRSAVLSRYTRAQGELGFGLGAGDPYSALAENRTRLESDRRGIRNTAGNQLYAGSVINAQSAARTAFDRRQKDIDSAIAEEQSDFNRGQLQTSRDEALGNAAIKEGAIKRAAATEPQPLAPGRGRRRGRGRMMPAPRGNRRGRGRI